MSDSSCDYSPNGLTERADLAFSEAQLETALRGYIALLEGNSGDVYAWYRAASCLARLRERDAAKRSLSQVPLALAEQGQLLLALVALKDLQALDAKAARALMDDVAALYGAGSKRVDHARKAPPPIRPVRTFDELPSNLSTADPRVLKVMGGDACDKALERWEQSRGGSATLPHSPLLSDLDPRDLGALLSLLSVQTSSPGKTVIEQGSAGTSFYIVVRGVAEVAKDGVHLAYLRSGAFFGEMALLTSSPRAASVVAHGPLTVLELSREALGELAGSSPGVATVLADYTRDRLLRNLLATSELFKPLDPPRREALVDLFTSQVFPPGEIVLQEGEDPEGGLYVVLSGEVRVSKREDGDELTLAHLGPGQVFGEISLIKSRPATATITALTKTVVLCLPRDAFNEHVGSFPEVLAHVFHLAQEREQSNRQLKEREVLAVDDDVLI